MRIAGTSRAWAILLRVRGLHDKSLAAWRASINAPFDGSANDETVLTIVRGRATSASMPLPTPTEDGGRGTPGSGGCRLPFPLRPLNCLIALFSIGDIILSRRNPVETGFNAGHVCLI